MTRFLILGALAVLAVLAIWHPVPHAAGFSTARAPANAHGVTRARRVAPAVESLVIYVAGAVAKPGLYEVKLGARAADAMRLAGGLTAAADPVGVNLAEKVSDGEEVAVPRIGDGAVRPYRRARTRRTTRAKKRRRAAPAEPMQSVDINTADAQTLAQLPGIGDTLAQRIVTYRAINGNFNSLDELLDVSGITDRRIEQMAPFLIIH
ncbi:MAG: helix-hairpin-helix domain-containing protein [Candidatus Eremiobacteraeota bacterium]|nr:helix-hairpin-helix domain-containing protein [Candidatus Eremiobacteraeota bacterium]